VLSLSLSRCWYSVDTEVSSTVPRIVSVVVGVVEARTAAAETADAVVDVSSLPSDIDKIRVEKSNAEVAACAFEADSTASLSSLSARSSNDDVSSITSFADVDAVSVIVRIAVFKRKVKL